MNEQEMLMENLIEPRVLVDLMNSEINRVLEERKEIKVVTEGIEQPKFSENEVKEIISEAFGDELQSKIINLLFSQKIFDKLTNKLINNILSSVNVTVKSMELGLEKK